MPLNRSQSVSVLAMRSLRAADDLRALASVVDLLDLSARPTVIERLTGFPPKVIRALHRREVTRSSQGRYSTNFARIIQFPVHHVAATLFIQEFVAAHSEAAHELGLPFREAPIEAPAFIHAYRHYLTCCRGTASMPVETLLWLADEFIAGGLSIAKCTTDDTRYLQLSTPGQVGWSIGRGECPLCRASAVSSLDRRTFRTFAPEEAKARFERAVRLLGEGKTSRRSSTGRKTNTSVDSTV